MYSSTPPPRLKVPDPDFQLSTDQKYRSKGFLPSFLPPQKYIAVPHLMALHNPDASVAVNMQAANQPVTQAGCP